MCECEGTGLVSCECVALEKRWDYSLAQLVEDLASIPDSQVIQAILWKTRDQDDITAYDLTKLEKDWLAKAGYRIEEVNRDNRYTLSVVQPSTVTVDLGEN